MLKFSEQFEKIISQVLLGFAMAIITYQVVQLIWNTVGAFGVRFREVGLEYAPEYAKNIAVMFFNILLMIEIMQTIKVFASDHIVKLRVIMIVCMIAVSRKILELGEHPDPKEMLGIAALIICLAVGFFLVSKYSDDTLSHTSER